MLTNIESLSIGLTFLVGSIFLTPVTSFPNGAPIEACIRGNTPNHPSTHPLSISTSPYVFTASDNTYSLGSTIHGNLKIL